jgi:hypothetical protein
MTFVMQDADMKRIFGAALILLSVTACTDTGPIKVGPDTYQIATRVAFGGPASAKGDALKEANAFCESKNREMLLSREQSSECALHGGCGEAEIVFYCLTSDDPQLKRPQFHSDP